MAGYVAYLNIGRPGHFVENGRLANYDYKLEDEEEEKSRTNVWSKKNRRRYEVRRNRSRQAERSLHGPQRLIMVSVVVRVHGDGPDLVASGAISPLTLVAQVVSMK